MNKIEMGRRYTHRDGVEVRVICTDAGGVYPVVVLRGVYTYRTTETGVHTIGIESPYDLIEVRGEIKVDCWLNIYPSGLPCAHVSKAIADCDALPDRFACIPFIREVEKGEGL